MRMKYLWTLALAVLCASVMAGSAVAQDAWSNAGTSLPGALTWDEAGSATVDAENTGSTTWDSATYELLSVEGTTGAVSAIDRWGLTLVSMATPTTDPGDTETFSFTITAPPITGTFECDWVLGNTGTPINTALAPGDVEISRFSDVGLGYWASSSVEACAGNVPFIVRGFPDGLYRPTLIVNRDAMAVFIRRGMDVVLTTPTGQTFPDVAPSYWAYYDIENLAAAGVVEGYPNGYYRPEYTVSRDQMAVFVARANSYALTTPATPDFPDVPLDYWAVQEVNACVREGVVQGYPDGLYRPLVNIDRAQMAVYSERAFVSPSGGTGAAVVAGGPAATDVNPGTAAYDGWTSVDTDAGYVYVVFEAARLDSGLANPTWDVTFDFRDAATPTIAGTTVTVAVAAGSITAPVAGTYFTVYTPVPGLASGDYVVVVTVEDKQGDLIDLARTIALTIS